MKNKILTATLVLVAILFFSVSLSFAENPVQGLVNGTENVVKNAGGAIANGTQHVVNGVEHGTGATANATHNTATALTTGTHNNNYAATRTSTGTNARFLGMTANMWTWTIMGIVGVATIALIWYYVRQNNAIENRNED